MWWKWPVGIFGAVIVAWALAEWVPNTELTRSPDTELDQAIDPASLQPATSVAERAALTNDPGRISNLISASRPCSGLQRLYL